MKKKNQYTKKQLNKIPQIVENKLAVCIQDFMVECKDPTNCGSKKFKRKKTALLLKTYRLVLMAVPSTTQHSSYLHSVSFVFGILHHLEMMWRLGREALGSVNHCIIERRDLSICRFCYQREGPEINPPQTPRGD